MNPLCSLCCPLQDLNRPVVAFRRVHDSPVETSVWNRAAAGKFISPQKRSTLGRENEETVNSLFGGSHVSRSPGSVSDGCANKVDSDL